MCLRYRSQESHTGISKDYENGHDEMEESSFLRMSR